MRWSARTGFIIGIVVSLGLVGVYLLWSNLTYTYHGSVIDPAPSAVDIQLSDAIGQPFHLADQAGKTTLIYFGYTNCTDECPVALADLKKVVQNLGSQAANVRVVFVTIDPLRDTPAFMKDYLAAIDPAFIGITATEAALDPIWKGYGVYREVQAGELIDHPGLVYVVDRDNRLRLTFPSGTPYQDMVADVRHLLQGSSLWFE